MLPSRISFPVNTMNIHAPQWLPVSRQTTNLTSHFFSPQSGSSPTAHFDLGGLFYSLAAFCMQNARPADNHCKELRVQSVLTFNLHVYRGPRLAHVSPIQCTGPSTSSSTSWSKVTVKLRIFTSGHWQSVSAITSPSPQQWLNPYFGNPDWLSDLNHCCPCFGNTDSPVRYGTRIVFLDWSICKGSPLLMKYDKLFRKSHFRWFCRWWQKAQLGRGPFDQLLYWQEEMVAVGPFDNTVSATCVLYTCLPHRQLST